MANYGYLRQDSDSHWYLIPENTRYEFAGMMDKIYQLDEGLDEWEDAIDDFITKFGKYRLSGGITDLKILME